MDLSAQHKPFQFGFKGGLNLGWFASDAEGYSNNGVRFGGSWGFAADFFLMDNYSITSGFEIIYLNGNLSYPDHKPHEVLAVMIDGTTDRIYKTRYLELPIIFTMKTNNLGKVRYYGQIGLGIGFLLSAKAEEKFSATDNSMTAEESLNIYEETTLVRPSLILGTGIEIPIQGSTYIRAGVKFDNALLNIMKGNNNVDQSIKNNGRNSFIELNASVFF